MKRLSLGLSRTNEDTFNPFPTHDPKEMLSEEGAAPNGLVADDQPRPKTVSTHALTTMDPDEPEKEDPVKHGFGDLPLPRPQRFSLLGFRHASDPQLFTRFRQEQEERTPPKETARMYIS